MRLKTTTSLIFLILLFVTATTQNFRFNDTNCDLGVIAGAVEAIGSDPVWFSASLADSSSTILLALGTGEQSILVQNISVGAATQILITTTDATISESVLLINQGMGQPELASPNMTDTDSERARIGGFIDITTLSNTSSLAAQWFEVLYATSNTTALPGPPMLTVDVQDELPQTLTIANQTVLPDSVTHLLVYVVSVPTQLGVRCRSSGVAVRVRDVKSLPPRHAPLNVTLLDESCESQTISGVVNVTCATQQNDVDRYAVYLRNPSRSSISSQPDHMIANISKCAENQTHVTAYVSPFAFGDVAYRTLVAKSYSFDSAEVTVKEYDCIGHSTSQQ